MPYLCYLLSQSDPVLSETKGIAGKDGEQVFAAVKKPGRYEVGSV